MHRASLQSVTDQLPVWGAELGFSGVAVSRIQLDRDLDLLQRWVESGRHAGMQWMERSLSQRRDLNTVHPGTLSVISVKQPCWTDSNAHSRQLLKQPEKGYIARYALGRDYHKTLRQQLLKLARRLQESIPDLRFRVATDSAPLLEKAMARDASLGWIGKNTLLIDPTDGSQFLLGEILTDLPLPPSRQPEHPDRCGDCVACIQVCPTRAITGPGELDARRCIAYWTIEHKGSIPVEWRKAIGNRIFGCDDCQLVCPWNRLAASIAHPDFAPRHQLQSPPLLELWEWSREQYEERLAGMPLRRPGWLGWRRNLCIALGNAPADPSVIQALESAPVENCDWWEELRRWALNEQRSRAKFSPSPPATTD